MTTATILYEVDGPSNTSARVFANTHEGFNVVGYDKDARDSFTMRVGFKTFESAKAYADTMRPKTNLDEQAKVADPAMRPEPWISVSHNFKCYAWKIEAFGILAFGDTKEECSAEFRRAYLSEYDKEYTKPTTAELRGDMRQSIVGLKYIINKFGNEDLIAESKRITCRESNFRSFRNDLMHLLRLVEENCDPGFDAGPRERDLDEMYSFAASTLKNAVAH